jgi:hypothetical protein
MSEMRVELPCKNCGNVFSIFVREAAEHKGNITRPACGRLHEYNLADITKVLPGLTEQVVIRAWQDSSLPGKHP